MTQPVNVQLSGRRQFLATAGGGAGWLALAAMLGDDGFPRSSQAAEARVRAPHFVPRAKRVKTPLNAAAMTKAMMTTPMSVMTSQFIPHPSPLGPSGLTRPAREPEARMALVWSRRSDEPRRPFCWGSNPG